MPWFANRAQILQVVCAVIGAFVALMVWFAIPPQNLLYVAPIAFLICLVWGVWMLSGWYTLSHLPPHEAQSEKEIPSTVQTSTASIALAKVTCDVGGFWEDRVLGKRFRIMVHAIKKIKNENEYRADDSKGYSL